MSAYKKPQCIHCGFKSLFISSGLCPECIRLRLIEVEKLIMDAPCQTERPLLRFHNGKLVAGNGPSEEGCLCVSCCSKTALVLLTNKFANPKDKTDQ